MINVRFHWDGDLVTFATIGVDDPILIPNVGDTFWMRALTDDAGQGVLPVIEVAVLHRSHHLFVDLRSSGKPVHLPSGGLSGCHELTSDEMQAIVQRMQAAANYESVEPPPERVMRAANSPTELSVVVVIGRVDKEPPP